MQGSFSKHCSKDVTDTVYSSVQLDIKQDRPTSYLSPNMHGHLGDNFWGYWSVS
jgi:hypothetical protein